MVLKTLVALSIPVVFTFLCLGSLITYDVNSHESFQKSTTGKYLKNTGILGAYQSVYKQAATKLPIAIANINKATGPYVESLLNGLNTVYRQLLSSIEPITVWCNKNIPRHLEYLTEDLFPRFLDNIAHWTLHASEYLSASLDTMKKSSISFGSWAQENLNLGEKSFQKLQFAVTDFAHACQSAMIDAFNWAHQQFVG